MRRDKKREKAELVEFVRYAQLKRDDFDLSDEFAAAVYATWFLLNPVAVDGRESIGTVSVCEANPPKDMMKDAIKFTAHAHASEPQTASPDDELIYSAITGKESGAVNFITDEFSCKRIL